MAPPDDWGGVPVQTTPNGDDWGGVPVTQAAPKLPDVSGLQKTVQDKLAVPQEGEQKSQSDQQKLDAGLGMPVLGGQPDTPLPANIRGHLMDSYANGTSTSAGDYMQTALPAAAHAVTNPDVGGELSNALQRTGSDVVGAAGMVAGFIPDSVARLVYTGAQRAGLAPLSEPVDEMPSVFGAFQKLGEIVFPGGSPQNEIAKKVDQAATMTATLALGGGAALPVTAWRTMYLSAAGIFGPQVQEKATQWARTTFPNEPFIQEVVSQAANLGTMLGIAGAGHVAENAIPGHEALKPIVAAAMGKPVESITPQDINSTIAKGYDPMGPKAQDFHDVATAMDANRKSPPDEPPPGASPVGALKQFSEPLYTNVPKKPLSLADFVRKNGGINDEGGDVSAMLGGAKYRPGLINGSGKSIDEMARAAHESGFFPEKGEERPSINEFKDKLNEDVRGNSQHSEHDINAVHEYHEALNRNAEIDRMSTETGIDTKGKTHAQFWGEVTKKLSPQDIDAKIDEFSNRAEVGSESWRTEALEPEEHEVMELENARKKKQAAEAELIGTTRSSEPGSVSGREEQSQAVAGRIGSGVESAGGANEVTSGSGSTAAVLRLIYRETGRRPDAVFTDAQSDPSIARDIAAGRVPDAYEHLKEKAGGGNGSEPPGEPPEQGFGPSPKKQTRSSEAESSTATKLNFPRVLFDPAHISEAAQDMATAIRQAKGPQSQTESQIGGRLKEHMKAVNALSKNEQLNFIHYMENEGKGKTSPVDIPEHLKSLAQELRTAYNEMHKQANAAGIDVGYMEGYHPHEYENEKAYKKFYSDWIAKQGGTRNLKERIFPTLKEAMEYGLKPKTTNPIEAAMNYISNMGNLIAAHKVLRAATEAGVADFFVKGNQPEGWVPLNGNLNEQSHIPEGSNTGEKISKILYAPEDAARVYNNDISQQATSPFDTVADAVQRVSNFATKTVLSLSGYHSVLTALSSTASDLGRALTGGTAMERASDVAHAIIPGMNVRKGGKYLNAYLGREQLPEGLQKALDLAVKNNTINPVQQDYWKATAAEDFWNVFKDGGVQGLVNEAKGAAENIKERPVVGTLKVIANGFGRTLDTLTHPIFDFQVPRLKIAANIEELHDWLQAHPDSTPKEQDRAAQTIGDSIDNRFGEMMRDNLFWHKWTRDSMQLTFLSYSWVAGALRMVGGVPDMGAWMLSKGKEELSPSAKYLFGTAAAYALANSMMTYISTGQGPSDWKDLFTYRTGGHTPQGTPERVLLPSHIGQFMHYIHDGLTGELANELSPLFKLSIALRLNKDFRDKPITNENNSWFTAQPWADYLEYIGQNEEPMGAKNLLQGEKKGSKINKLEQFMGNRPAPEFFAAPQAYDRMMKNIHDKEWQKKLRSDRHLQQQYKN